MSVRGFGHFDSFGAIFRPEAVGLPAGGRVPFLGGGSRPQSDSFSRSFFLRSSFRSEALGGFGGAVTSFCELLLAQLLPAQRRSERSPFPFFGFSWLDQLRSWSQLFAQLLFAQLQTDLTNMKLRTDWKLAFFERIDRSEWLRIDDLSSCQVIPLRSNFDHRSELH